MNESGASSIELSAARRDAVHTDPGELKNMRNSITLEFMQRYDSIGLHMTKN